MRKLVNKLPKAIRWLIITAILTIIVGGSAYAYVALMGTGQVTIQECLSFIGSNTFAVTLYPQETKMVQLTVANASPIDLSVDLNTTITPDPQGKGLTVSVPSKITVPAIGQVVVTITITATKNATPGTYQVSVEFAR